MPFCLNAWRAVFLTLVCTLGQSRQFAFARFTTISDAKAFLERNYPKIYLYGTSASGQQLNHGAKVRIAFTREREERAGKSEDDWICKVVSFWHRRESLDVTADA
jgi:hypothetical protein